MAREFEASAAATEKLPLISARPLLATRSMRIPMIQINRRFAVQQKVPGPRRSEEHPPASKP